MNTLKTYERLYTYEKAVVQQTTYLLFESQNTLVHNNVTHGWGNQASPEEPGKQLS